MDPLNPRYQPGTRVSEYVLDAPIAAGSFGEVWRAHHHVWNDTIVAIKVPTAPEYVRYLQREGVVVHGLRHPNIIRVLGLDPYAAVPYLVMELVKGPSLRTVIDQHRGGLPVDATVAVLRGVLRAMSAAHGAGVIHRDLKPGNVLLNLEERPIAFISEDDVKVGDFGLGVGGIETLRSIAQSVSMDQDQQLVGTIAYMAPEVRDGSRPHDARTDLFAIGIMLFEMLTGERPAGAELPSDLRPASPPALDQVFTRLYARYDRRYESADAALREMEGALSSKRAAKTPPPPPTETATTRSLARVRCGQCAHENEAGSQFCVMCAAQLVADVRRCPRCDGYPGADDNYCIFCGAALTAAKG